MLVQEVMNTRPLCVNSNARLGPAIQQMTDSSHSCIVVIEQEKPCGIITERDIAKAFADAFDDCEKLKDAFSQHVSDIMTSNPVCIDAGMSCPDALTLSRSRSLRHLPVVDNKGCLIGIVTQTSLMDAFASLLNEQARLETSLEELRALSLEDPLMKIGNRRAMEVDLNYTAAEAERHQRSYALALFDIDFFKRYNDHYGHLEGDEALRKVADGIKQSIRDSDRTYRYGGEEILVLMPDTNEEQAAICAERVRATIESMQLEHQDGKDGILTISGGYATHAGDHWESMIERADEALYQAKNSGRNAIAAANLP